jgi:aryl-alcohol dehydrogenase-like predicted oxidoreductase
MKTNKLILGTVQMGLSYGINNPHGKIKDEESHKIFKMAFESDIRFLDSAETYGNAHEVIGDFHTQNPKYKFKVITKIPPLDRIDNIDNKIEQYLQELNINELECLMFHSFQSYKKNLNLIPQLELSKEKGQIKQLGVSIYTNEELKELIDENIIDVIQLPFNLLDNFSLRGKLLNEAKSKGIIIHTRSAFLQGLVFKNPHDENAIAKLIKPQLIEINKLAQDANTSIGTLALAYCIEQSCINQVLIGVDSANQLQFNLNALEYQIPKAVIKSINRIKTYNKDLLNPALWEKLTLNSI